MFIIKSMNKRLKTLLPDNIEIDLAFQGKQLSSCFNIKGKTEFLHKHDLVYHAEYPKESCNDNYVGETTILVTLNKRTLDEKQLFVYITLIAKCFLTPFYLFY